MFKFNNSHIFTGYLKQLLSSVNLPTCRIYTKEFADYFKRTGKEDPRVIESFDTVVYTGGSTNKMRAATRVNYLKANELYNYFWDYSQASLESKTKDAVWKRASSIFYDKDKSIPGLTRVLNSPGSTYNVTMHEYLGEYLRFMRDYHNINLMSLYNCFNNKICNNIYYKHTVKVIDSSAKGVTDKSKNTDDFNLEWLDGSTEDSPKKAQLTIKVANDIKGISADNVRKYKDSYRVFDSQDSNYRIYAFPVKLFANYTIAVDCDQGLEMFCGLYTDTLETTDKGEDLITKTYKKVNKALFKQPFLYDALDVEHWNFNEDVALTEINKSKTKYPKLVTGSHVTRWDIANREQDLKLFIKVPSSCRSSIVVLEGDFRGFNDIKYAPVKIKKQNGNVTTESTVWDYKQNHSVLNFKSNNLNDSAFTPICKTQLLALNTGESYPFADRLVEYLCGSTITPIDPIADNIKRIQKVMSQNHHYFKIDGMWEDKMQKIIYDYMINTGPIVVSNGKLEDERRGYHPTLGHKSKSTLYDVLGYIDKEAEKYYASWVKENGTAAVHDSIQNVDIYDGLYDL